VDESTNRYWGYVVASLSLGAMRSMDVSVLSKNGQRSLRSAVRTSVLGDGLLERTRSTSLALLGLTAAIGLAMVALALNQGWPLIAGAPIPGFEGERQAVGDATVAARARTQGVHSAIAAIGRTSPGVSSGKSGRSQGGTVALAESQAPQSTDLVVAHPTPASPAGGSAPGDAIPNPAPVTEQAVPAPAPAAATVPVSSSASSSPGPASQGIPEAPTTSQVPPAGEENDEHDHGHRSGRGAGHSHSYGYGHGHSHGGDDPETAEPGESPETTPAPAEAPPPEADQAGESESEQSHASSWGHVGDRGHEHGRGHW
jgi:hypothetical protein